VKHWQLKSADGIPITDRALRFYVIARYGFAIKQPAGRAHCRMRQSIIDLEFGPRWRQLGQAGKDKSTVFVFPAVPITKIVPRQILRDGVGMLWPRGSRVRRAQPHSDCNYRNWQSLSRFDRK
jgi:hypothetical protein